MSPIDCREKLFILIVCGALGWANVGHAQPRNVIFLIGDGMGPEQVRAGGMYAYGQPGTLSFEAFAHQGELTTYSASSSTTDSAAAGTAMATGIKVNNGVISMAYPGDGTEIQTLLEYSQSLGKSTGLVTTTYLTHATPGAFAAHETSRYNYPQIANDYLNQTRPNVLFGGTLYMSGAAAAGYTVVTDAQSMLAMDTESATMISGQFGSGSMPYEYDGVGDLPHLSEMVATALAILDNDANGFFLMVEGGRIDHACHSNNLPRAVGETIEFANAVQVVVDWAAGRNDTLILVTADHETGDLTVTANNGAGNYPLVTWGTAGHSTANVPVYAWGVNADLISGVMDNTDLFCVVVNDGTAVAQPIPYTQDFASTKPGLCAGWEYYSDNEGRIDLASGQLRMDDTSGNSTYSLNEAILHLDLDGQNNVTLTLDHQSNGDENDPLSSSFTGHSNGDGISISADGADWRLLTNLTSSFTSREFDLDAAIQSAGITYTADFQIKFQQYDNYPNPSDGRSFDNIVVNAGGQTVYVDGVGGSDSGGTGAQANPYKTVQKAMEEASNGDKIIILAGTYPENLTINKAVTIEARNGLVRIGQ